MALISGGEPRRGVFGRTKPKVVRDVQTEQARRGGMNDAAESAAQDDFANRLMRDAEAAERARRHAQSTQMSPAARRAMGVADEPPQKQKYLHVTDEPNVRGIREGGIREGNRFDNPAVWAYEGGATPENMRNVPEGRVGIEFEADPARAKLRGTTPGSRARGLVGGGIDPGSITGGYSRAGRLFDLGTSGTGLAGLLGLLATNLPGFTERFPRTTWLANGGPFGDAFQQTLTENPISPYNPRWQETTLA